MSEPHRKSESASRNGKPAAASPPAEEPAGAIEQAVALRDLLRDAANKATSLIRTLQHDKKQGRQLRSALASLREIQKLEV